MRSTQRISFVAVLLIVAMSLMPYTAQAGDIIMNHFGFLYETGGFPVSTAGDTLTGVGVLTNVNPAVGWNFTTDEFTWIKERLDYKKWADYVDPQKVKRIGRVRCLGRTEKEKRQLIYDLCN